jgi:hypothetical protein
VDESPSLPGLLYFYFKSFQNFIRLLKNRYLYKEKEYYSFIMGKKIKMSSREEAEEFVQMVLNKANNPDTDPKPYDGSVANPKEVEKLTNELKNKFADKS